MTVREMSAVRFSFSFSISSRFFPTNVSSLAVSRSRKSAIARCSSGGGMQAQSSPITVPFRFG